jgi:hypothetical protein
MDVAFLTSSTNYSSASNKLHVIVSERQQGQRHSPPVTGDGIPHQEIEQLSVEDENAAMAAIQNLAVGGVFDTQEEARCGDVVRWIQRGGELDVVVLVLGEEAEEGRLAVVLAKAAEEMGVRDEAAPPLADERGAREGGRQRREAPEDLGQDVVVVQRGRRRRRAGEDREVTA